MLNFTSNLAALIFFVIAGLPVWEIGLVMAAGGFLGARMALRSWSLKVRSLSAHWW
ncbi:putative membrane protein YfcA [Vibrio variabilis]|uniref:Membrane protein YfcA n=1 Tax=Vibrio variabilis TaxID=990271 RepID=A0ABQ0J5K8_9VIBR|nr:putative membrane protein YfcA [Vibrio variabilis]